MRILLVEFGSAISGAERSLLELVQGLKGEHEIALACPNGPLAHRALELGVDIRPIPASQLSFRLHPRHTPCGVASMAYAAMRLRRVVKSLRPDVVHANSIRAGLLAIPAARGLGPVVVHCRDALPGGPAGAAVRTAVRAGADRVVAISRHVATSFAGAGWADRGVTVVDNAVDLVRFDPSMYSRSAVRAGLAVDSGLVLSVIAQITPWKGQDLAINTLAELRRRGREAMLLVVGEAKFLAGSTRYDNRAYEEELHALVAALDLNGAVHFLGERSDPERLLAATDVLLVPSTEEPFGRTIIEAMAMGVPVAATNRGGPPEILGDGIGGLVVPARDAPAWADAVEELARRPADRRAAARAAAETRFSRERHVATMLAVYRSAIAPRPRPSAPPSQCHARLTEMRAAVPSAASEPDVAYLQDRWDREQAFHDEIALELDPRDLPPVPLAHYDEAVLAAADVSPGTRVLDLGCGQGDLTLALLERGAEVCALDLSPGMVALARRRVELYANGRQAGFVAAPVERSGLPSGSFEVIVGRWILHHVDLRPAAVELARLLAPGGRAVFLENSGANPVLSFMRDHVTGRFGIPRLGTKDERPLVAEDWAILEHSFRRAVAEFPVVEIFGLLNRQVFRYRSAPVGAVCRHVDRLIGCTRLRKYSYRVLVVAEK